MQNGDYSRGRCRHVSERDQAPHEAAHPVEEGDKPLSESTSIFGPARYEDIRVAPMQAAGLPFYTYTSPEWFEREIDRIFMKEWIFACRVEDVPKAGDYHYFEFINEPVVIVRGKDEVIRAFSASCRHRGTPIVSDHGSCKILRCPYHSWTYALDGTLLGGPPEMHETENFDKSAYGLIPIRLEVWAGFVYITLNPAAAPLKEFLGDLPEKLAPYNLADMRVAWRTRYDLSCNWKIYVENAMEEYHVATVHLKTIQETLPMSAWGIDESHGEYMAMYGRMPGSLALLKGSEGFDEIATLGEKERNGSYIILTNPNTMFGFTVDTCWWLQILPVAPGKTTVLVGACFPSAACDRPDFKERASVYYERWRTTLEEDNAISELQQKGVRTRLNYRVGRLSHRELLVHTIANYILDRVVEDADVAPA
jgi:choline monooxygenase